MKKFFFALTSVLTIAAGASAQTVQDAVKKTLNERYETAAQDFNRLRKAQPTNPEVYFFSGDNYFYWDHLDSAAMMFSAGIKAAPNHALNYIGLGRIAMRNNDVTKALENFTQGTNLMNAKGTTVDKNSQVVGYLKMAEAFIQEETKKPDMALAHIQSALKISPTNPEAFIQWGDLNLMQSTSNLTSAIDKYEEAYEKDPKYTRALLRQGQLWIRVEKYETALEWFNKAIEQDPTFAPAYREKGELYFLAGKPKQAVEAYEKYLELNDDLSARSRYAKFLFLNKQYDLSLQEIDKVMQVDSSDCILYRLKGYASYETGKFPEGLQNMNRFIDCATKTGKNTILASDYAYRGKLHSKMTNDSLSLIDLEIAIAMDSNYVEGYGDLAALYFKRKNYPVAAQYYEQKIRKSEKPAPTDISSLGQTWYRLAESLREISKTDSVKARERMDLYRKADEQFALITTSYPIYANAWRGRTNSKLDNQEQPAGFAKPYYELAITNAGADPAVIEANKKDLIEAYSYLGFFYYSQANYDCSKVAWMKVQELDPVNEKAKAALTDKDIMSAPGTCVLIAAK